MAIKPTSETTIAAGMSNVSVGVERGQVQIRTVEFLEWENDGSAPTDPVTVANFTNEQVDRLIELLQEARS